MPPAMSGVADYSGWLVKRLGQLANSRKLSLLFPLTKQRGPHPNISSPFFNGHFQIV